MQSLLELLAWLVQITLVSGLIGGLAAIVAYVVVRSASFAYFRTKLDFLRRARKLKRNGEH